MRSHLRSMAKRKVSDFLLREEGMVGNRSAFATAAFVSTTALAATLLVAPDAEAHNNLKHCPQDPDHCPRGFKCCWVWRNQVMYYDCVNALAQCP